jgi:hypothetical protein
MLQIKGPSDKPCFICSSSQETRVVKFEDKTFSGVLCMKHIAEKTNGQVSHAQSEPSKSKA